jgi:hypothetical protein
MKKLNLQLDGKDISIEELQKELNAIVIRDLPVQVGDTVYQLKYQSLQPIVVSSIRISKEGIQIGEKQNRGDEHYIDIDEVYLTKKDVITKMKEDAKREIEKIEEEIKKQEEQEY